MTHSLKHMHVLPCASTHTHTHTHTYTYIYIYTYTTEAALADYTYAISMSPQVCESVSDRESRVKEQSERVE